jgi:Zn-finger nucleic acid-binding protein
VRVLEVTDPEATLKKCPKCGSALVSRRRHNIEVDFCEACDGMWLDRQELGQLEDEVFFLGDHAKGTLVADAAKTDHKCPVCSSALTEFTYRFQDLKIEACENQHGYWLDQNEDTRILELMKKEQLDTARSIRAEDKWSATLQHMRSSSFLDRLRGLFK